MTAAFQDHQIRQYLLGDLPAPEEFELETAYFKDPVLLARIENTRNDLIDDYAAGRLSAADRERFERRILSTPSGREEVAVARALRKRAGSLDAPAKPRWHLDRSWLSLAALVPLVVGALLAWRIVSAPGRVAPEPRVGTRPPETGQVQSPDGPAGATQPTVDSPSRPRPARESPGPVATLILTTDLERSAGLPPTFLTPTKATQVDLILPAESLSRGARAHIRTVEGATVWQGAVIVPDGSAPDPRPRVRVPASSLRPGDYLLSTESGDLPGTPYYFRVRER